MFTRKKILLEERYPCQVSSEKHSMSWLCLLDALGFPSPSTKVLFQHDPVPRHLLFLVPISYLVSTFPEESSFPASPAFLEHSIINHSPFLGSPSISGSSHIPGPFLPFLTQAPIFRTALHPQNLDPNSRSKAQNSQVILPVLCPCGEESLFIGTLMNFLVTTASFPKPVSSPCLISSWVSENHRVVCKELYGMRKLK